MSDVTILAVGGAVMALALLNIVVNGLLARRGQRINRPVEVIGRRRGE